jgi:hypothetical protein
MDPLTALFFTASSVVHAWEFFDDLSAVGGIYQLQQPFCSQLSLVSSVLRHVAVYFRATCIFV